jgi:hypothetical protein
MLSLFGKLYNCSGIPGVRIDHFPYRELRRLSLALRNAAEDEAPELADRVERVQQSLDAVLERMAPQAPDYVALRRGLPVEFDDIKACLQTT